MEARSVSQGSQHLSTESRRVLLPKAKQIVLTVWQ